jgi:cation diffusion facilitator family transporter
MLYLKIPDNQTGNRLHKGKLVECGNSQRIDPNLTRYVSSCPLQKHRVQWGCDRVANHPPLRREIEQEIDTISMTYSNHIQQEKVIVALSSVVAAIGLTSLKIVVGILTGSLGILAEAAHSGLDLVAALMTLFAVRVADRPADSNHNYGHGKVENLSAFLEALLLLVTAVWVIYEAVRRLFFGDVEVEVNIWAFIVMLISIIVDFSRSRALLRVAKKVGSAALEADALHFRTDIWSSAVVIGGLLVVMLTEKLGLPQWLNNADAIAALVVSGIVIWVSMKLARETVDALVDHSPNELALRLHKRIGQLNDVLETRRLRIRRAGNKFFVDVIIAAPRTLSFEQTHALTDTVEDEIHSEVLAVSTQGDIDVIVHVEPVAAPTETVIEQIHYEAERLHLHAHDIHIREIGDKLEADFDVEVHDDMVLEEAHTVATQLEQAILQQNQRIHRVTTHLEAPAHTIVPRRDVTQDYSGMVKNICCIADGIAGAGKTHELCLYRSLEKSDEVTSQNESDETPELDLVFHTTFAPHIPLSQAHVEAEEIKRALWQAYPNLNSITIHTEPPEQA